MKKYILLLSVLVFGFSASVWATPEETPPPEGVSVTITDDTKGDAAAEPASTIVDQADLKKLVETLESETARTEFLTNLKTLLAQQEESKKAAEDAALPLTEQIGVRSFISGKVSGYEAFLERHNLSGSTVNQILGCVVVLMVVVILLIAEKRMIRRLMRLVDRLGSKIEVSVRGLRSSVKFFNVFVQTLIAIFAGYTISKIWGIELIDSAFESQTARTLLSNGMTVLLLLFLAVLIWEAINLYLEYILRKANTNNQTRAKTLLPIIRNIVVAIFVVMFGLVLLSELGINVTPLLAGAGVLGVAIGFGAQSMVKDFLTGFTIILEDLVRVGDVVNLAGVAGSVERITLRKIQLRDYSGVVYTIPYSEIKTIQNLTKDFSYYVMDVSVAYDTSIDQVIDVLRQVDEDLRKDDAFSFMIMEPLEIAGLDKFADSAVVIRCRIKTLPIRQWVVGREFNRRMKRAFDENGIEIPFPQRTINVRGPAEVLANPDVKNAILAKASD
jgi:small-conductance mechanosensitive channel